MLLVMSQSSSSLFVVQVGSLPKFLDQWRSITPHRFMLNIVRSHHLQLRCCPPLFFYFRHFNIKATPAHLFIIQKDMDELLAMGTNEQFIGKAYSNIYVVPKQMGGLHPVLNFK